MATRLDPVTINASDGRMAGLMSDPVLAKITFARLGDHPSKHKLALMNPADMTISASPNWGTLNPIGWSQPVRHYAYTNAPTMSITLEFDTLLMLQRGYRFDEPQDMANWFMSFCYAPRVQRAPNPIIILWPGTLSITAIVENVSWTVKQWFKDGKIRRYSVALNLVEFQLKNSTFRDALDMMFDGYASAPGGIRGKQYSGAGNQQKMGKRVNMSGSVQRKTWGARITQS